MSTLKTNRIENLTTTDGGISIDNSGNVGIGTTTPGAVQHVVSADNSSTQLLAGATSLIRQTGHLNAFGGSYIEATNIAQSAYQPLGLNGSYLSLGTGGSERMRIDSSGRLLLGTSSSLATKYFSSAFQPDFQHAAGFGTAGFFRFKADADGCTLILNKSRNTSVGSHTVVNNGDTIGVIGFTGSDGTEFRTAAAIRSQVDGTPGTNDMPGRLVFNTTPDGSSTTAERMRINSAGNVGINTSSPNATFEVIGSARIGAQNTVAVPASNNGGGAHFSWNGIAGSAETDIYNLYDNAPKSFVFRQKTGASTFSEVLQIGTDQHVFFTSNTERMRITSAGRLGIGTSSPSVPLEVSGSSAQLRVISTAVDMRIQPLSASSVGIFGTDSNHALVLRTNQTERMRILSTGGLTFNGDTAQANALDDYEEGTWTPQFATNGVANSGATYATQVGQYTKIGNTVFVRCRCTMTNKGTLSSSSAIVGIIGLPFTVRNTGEGWIAATVGYVSGTWNTAAPANALFAFNSTGLNLYTHSTSSAHSAMSSPVLGSYLSNTSDIILSGTYITDA